MNFDNIKEGLKRHIVAILALLGIALFITGIYAPLVKVNSEYTQKLSGLSFITNLDIYLGSLKGSVKEIGPEQTSTQEISKKFHEISKHLYESDITAITALAFTGFAMTILFSITYCSPFEKHHRFHLVNGIIGILVLIFSCSTSIYLIVMSYDMGEVRLYQGALEQANDQIDIDMVSLNSNVSPGAGLILTLVASLLQSISVALFAARMNKVKKEQKAICI